MKYMKFAFLAHVICGAYQFYTSDILTNGTIHDKDFHQEKDFDTAVQSSETEGTGHMALLLAVVGLFIFFFVIDLWVYDFSNDLTSWVVDKLRKDKEANMNIYEQ